jgi:hypothetical protein
MKPHSLLMSVALAIFATSASAQKLDLKPGLWEVKHSVASASGEMERATKEMQQRMAAMPPEQRKMMEAMMAKQGLSVGSGGLPGMSVKICLTKEMLDRDQLPVQEGSCKTTLGPRAGDTRRMSFSCTNPPSSGEGEYKILNPEAYTMKLALRTAVSGKPENMNMEGAGRWLGSNCGSGNPAS